MTHHPLENCPDPIICPEHHVNQMETTPIWEQMVWSQQHPSYRRRVRQRDEKGKFTRDD